MYTMYENIYETSELVTDGFETKSMFYQELYKQLLASSEVEFAYNETDFYETWDEVARSDEKYWGIRAIYRNGTLEIMGETEWYEIEDIMYNRNPAYREFHLVDKCVKTLSIAKLYNLMETGIKSYNEVVEEYYSDAKEEGMHTTW